MVREAAARNARPWMPALVLPLLLAPCAGVTQDPASRIFADDAPLALRITGPFRALSRADSERPEHDAVLEVVGADGASNGIGIEIRVRGNSRDQKSVV